MHDVCWGLGVGGRRSGVDVRRRVKVSECSGWMCFRVRAAFVSCNSNRRLYCPHRLRGWEQEHVYVMTKKGVRSELGDC